MTFVNLAFPVLPKICIDVKRWEEMIMENPKSVMICCFS